MRSIVRTKWIKSHESEINNLKLFLQISIVFLIAFVASNVSAFGYGLLGGGKSDF